MPREFKKMAELDNDDYAKLSADLKEKAMMELNEDVGSRQYYIQQIREWNEQNEEISCRKDSSFILRFLRVCKFDEEKTKKRITRYFSSRQSNLQWFVWTDDRETTIFHIIRTRCMYTMNFEGGSKEVIAIAETGFLNPKTNSVEDVAHALMLMIEVLFEDPRLQISGFHIIANLQNVGLEVAMMMTPRFLWRYMSCWQFGLPVRIKGAHIINAPPLMYGALTLIRSFLNTKLKSRFFIHASATSLSDYFSPACLPDEFNGTAGPAQKFADATIDMLKNGKEFYCKHSLNQTMKSASDASK